jgi:hypothetical protein
MWCLFQLQRVFIKTQLKRVTIKSELKRVTSRSQLKRVYQYRLLMIGSSLTPSVLLQLCYIPK